MCGSWTGEEYQQTAKQRGPKRTVSQAAKIERMKAMRQSGRSLSEIGETFGITKERVRQLIGNTGCRPKPWRWPRAYFHRVMRQWLWAVGYRKCSTCKTWTDDMSANKRQMRCRRCNRENVRIHKQHKKKRTRISQK